MKSGEEVIENRRASKSLVELLSGSVAGCCNVLIGLPFDTLKVKMQTYPTVYPSLRTALHKTFRNEGVLKGFYSGYGPSLAANVGENAVLFFAYGWFREIILPKVMGIDKQGPIWNALAGSMASSLSSVVLCPTEMVKCRLQVQRHLYLGSETHITAGSVIKNIWNEGGIRGFFSGLTATWARELPGYFALFLGYEGTKFAILTYMTKEASVKKELSSWQTVFCGGIGGFTYWVLVFPMDIIKSRIQVKGETPILLQVIRKIVKEEGWPRLYKGVSAALLRSFPSTGALFLSYETTNSFLTKLVTT